MKKTLLLLLISVFSVSEISAQNFAYKVDFGFLFDNLEGSEPYAPTRTLIAVKLAPEIGVKIGTHHQLMVGASLIQDLGDSTFLTKADYTIYYKFSSERFNALAGSFPRTHTLGNYPRSFFREDYLFMDNNIEGVMAQYISAQKNGFVEFYVDWYGQNQKRRIDEFLLTASTEFSFYDKLLIVGGSALVNHYKNSFKLEDAGLYERVLYNIYVATDLQKLMPKLDRFRVGIGTNSSAEHKRYEEPERSAPWSNNIGWQFDIDVNWKGLGLKNEFYFGSPQLMYYNQYGNDMYWGTQFYQAKRYNFTELYYKREWKFITVKGGLAFHATSKGIANQQIITLGFNLHQMVKGGKCINLD